MPNTTVYSNATRTGILRPAMIDADHSRDAVHVMKLTDGPAFESAVFAVANERQPFVLESSASAGSSGRYSFLGFDPVRSVVVRTPSDSDWLAKLAAEIGPGDSRFRHRTLPFVGGWVGFISYAAGLSLENVSCSKRHDIALPYAQFALYDTVAVYDHQASSWFLAAADIECERRRPSPQERIERLATSLRSAVRPPELDWSRSVAGEPVASMSRDDYFDRVAAAQRYITSGDIYQVNLTQRFSAQTAASPITLYRRLRAVNPSAYAALLTSGQTAILSASPELFLELRDGRIVTRPIKGTRPRTGDDVLDAVGGRELLASEKDRAELTMIVDLLRNDLGRVSEFGSVRVLSRFDLESHPTVLHLVSTITGRMRDGLTWGDLVRASFPGGSITGCPKIRAMQIIDELETTERSVYCGSIGYIGLDGSMCLNIAIRTMVLDCGSLHLFGGGAIVADSQPQAEYDETIAKTAGMMRALRSRDSAARERSA